MTTFYIVRHGQTSANKAGLKQGTINSPQTYLTSLGKEQAANLAANFDISCFDRIYVSPLVRTQETAKILNEKAQLPLELDERLLEISYGSWDGQVNAELMAQYPQYFSSLVNDVVEDYVHGARGAESFKHVERRVADFTAEISREHPDEKIVVVTHGFTVRSFAINATNGSGLEILEPDNCSVTKILVDPLTQKQHLVYYNRIAASVF